MSISKQLWQSNQDIVKNCLAHPFIKGIAQGNLDRQKFTFYIGARYSAVKRRGVQAPEETSGDSPSGACLHFVKMPFF
jgi:hypothetical protein